MELGKCVDRPLPTVIIHTKDRCLLALAPLGTSAADPRVWSPSEVKAYLLLCLLPIRAHACALYELRNLSRA